MTNKRLISCAIALAVLVPILPLGGLPAFAGGAPPGPPSCLGSSETFDPLGRNVIVGTTGPDNIDGTPAADVIIGRAGKDTINGRGGNDLICGGEDASSPDKRDIIHGNAGQETILGNEGHDKLYGDTDRDNMFGNEGDDLLHGGANAPGVGDEANFWFAKRTVTANLTTGKARGEGKDRLVKIEGLGGSQYGDMLIGNSKENSLDGGISPSGNDVMKGRRGTDTLSLLFSDNNMLVNLQGGTSVGDGQDTFSSIENVIGSSYNDYITGTDGPNALFGSDGHDTLFGRGGEDVMLGFSGQDTMFGGVGVADFVSYSDEPGLAINLNLATGNVSRSDGDDTLDGVEMVEGSDMDDVLRGDNGPNFFYADEGSDKIRGRGGSDLIFFLGAGPGGVNVDLDQGIASGMSTGLPDDLANIEHVVGSHFGDELIGDKRRNFLNGSDGIDHVVGAAGNDYVSGGTGGDVLEGGPGGQDMVDFFQSRNGVNVNLATGHATGEGSDLLFDIEAVSGSRKDDTVRGDSHANSLYGQRGADALAGSAGKDHLDGGPSTDSLNGGPADDECFTKSEASSCEDFSKPDEHPLSSYSRRYKKAVAAARRYKRRYK